MKQVFGVLRGIGVFYHILLVVGALILDIASETVLRSAYETFTKHPIDISNLLSYPHILNYFFLFCIWYICLLGIMIYLIIKD